MIPVNQIVVHMSLTCHLTSCKSPKIASFHVRGPTRRVAYSNETHAQKPLVTLQPQKTGVTFSSGCIIHIKLGNPVVPRFTYGGSRICVFVELDLNLHGIHVQFGNAVVYAQDLLLPCQKCQAGGSSKIIILK